MKENNKGSMIILTIIGIATLLVSVIGATFAYFTINVRNNPTATNTVVKSKQLGVITFAKGNDINYQPAVPGRPVWSNPDDATNILNFTVTSPEGEDFSTLYNIYFNVTYSNFETDNIVYMLTQKDITQKGVSVKNSYTNDLLGKQVCENLDELGTIKNSDSIVNSTGIINNDNSVYGKCVNHTFVNNGVQDTNPTALGYIHAFHTPGEEITAETDDEDDTVIERILIGTATLGGDATTDSWEFEIWINEIGGAQNADQGRRIKGFIDIETASVQTNEGSYRGEPTTTVAP